MLYDSKNVYSKYDCGIASQSISLAAQSLGVASHIIATNEVAFMGEKGAYFKEKLQFPENYEFGLAVLLGYPAAPKAPHKPDPEKIIYVDEVLAIAKKTKEYFQIISFIFLYPTANGALTEKSCTAAPFSSIFLHLTLFSGAAISSFFLYPPRNINFCF